MRRRLASVTLAAAAAVAVAAPAMAADDALNAYRVKPTAENKKELAAAGYDLAEGDRGRYIEIYATGAQARSLRGEGVAAKQVTSFNATAAPEDYTGSDAEYDVWTRYDAVGGDDKEQYVEQYQRIAAEPIAKLESLGKTHLGRDLWAIKITKDAKTTADGSRPAVLYNAQQHAREWLAGETCRRTLEYVVDNYGTDEQVTHLVDTRELWFSCISNPDGYEYTFTDGNRLWRKNMADNDGDGTLGEPGDGVDPNRNFATNWGRDNEGSSDDPASETYRGTAPDSEPETKAMKGLWDRVDLAFQKNDHTAAELLLYPQGFQLYTPTPDNGIFTALAGNDAEPAIADKVFNADDEVWEIQDSPLDADTSGNRFDPDISAELYITNGDTSDDAYEHSILSFTPEGSEPLDENASGFVFQDDEEDVQAEFERHLRFALDLAESAADPANPVSHMGNTAAPFYVDEFAYSYGDPQAVEVTAKRSLGTVRLRYRINGGKVRTAPTKKAPGGEKYNNDPGVYYQRLRGEVKGTQPGDSVEVWFEGGRSNSAHFTYEAVSESRAKVLILSAENYTGPRPTQDPEGPHYLTYYTDTLDGLGVDYDIYDVDARGNVSPDHLGVLSHYDAVIWYTGDEELTRLPGQPAGTGGARLGVEEQIDVRDFLNEGGKLLFTGKEAGTQYANAEEFRNFGFPEPRDAADGEYCNKNGTDYDPETEAFDPWPEFDENDPTMADGCIPHSDDFLQYYLGAYVRASPGNALSEEGTPFDLLGTSDGPFAGQTLDFGETGAGNQDNAATFVVTSSILDPAQYPLYADSRKAADWLRPGAAPFGPFSGTQYMASGSDSRGYKRLSKTLDVPAGTTQFSFQISADVEADWDWVAVEVHDVAADTWTTLPDVSGNELTSDSTGESCAEGLASEEDAPHPFLGNYWNEDCTTKGNWNALTGSTGGWSGWTVDLSAFAGKEVEVSISYITDWGTLGLGVWVDDAKFVNNGTTIDSTDFEADAGGWAVGAIPEGSDELSRNWTRRGQEFEEGGIVITNDTVYTGFGFEGLSAGDRPEFMKRALKHLGVKVGPGGGPGPGPGPGPGGDEPAAKAKIKVGKRLRASRKGRVKVRIACDGDAGATCKGKVRLLRKSTKVWGAKRFTIAAGKAKTVKVKLRKSAFRALKRKGSQRLTIKVTGKDTAGTAFTARQKVRVLAPKQQSK